MSLLLNKYLDTIEYFTKSIFLHFKISLNVNIILWIVTYCLLYIYIILYTYSATLYKTCETVTNIL